MHLGVVPENRFYRNPKENDATHTIVHRKRARVWVFFCTPPKLRTQKAQKRVRPYHIEPCNTPYRACRTRTAIAAAAAAKNAAAWSAMVVVASVSSAAGLSTRATHVDSQYRHRSRRRQASSPGAHQIGSPTNSRKKVPHENKPPASAHGTGSGRRLFARRSCS